MLLDFNELEKKYDLGEHVYGVIHVGAHLAEEAADYNKLLNDAPIWWIEANPAVLGKIKQIISGYPNQGLIHALVTDRNHDERTFHVTNYDGMSSSVFDFGTHPQFSPDTTFVWDVRLPNRSLDSLVFEHSMKANMLVMDIQGAEGLALAGAPNLLKQLDFVMLEVNKEDVYVGCAKVWDLDDVLIDHGLHRVETHWVDGQGWGDGFWAKVPA